MNKFVTVECGQLILQIVIDLQKKKKKKMKRKSLVSR